jgi:hypothetical protein
MHITLEKTTKNKLAKLQLHLPWSFEEIHQDLEKETWTNPGSDNKFGLDLWEGWREKCHSPQTKTLSTLINFFRTDQLKKQLIGWLYENVTNFNTEYMMTQQELNDCCSLHGELVKDTPGFVNILHTDYRRLAATGMIYLTEHDDPNVSTVFYDSRERVNPVRMTTNFGDGWWHANGNDTYHEGWNRTNQFRYSFLLGLTLNIQPLRP